MRNSSSVPSLRSPRAARCRRSRTGPGLLAAFALATVATTAAFGAPTLNSVSPPQQRVYDMITLRGQDFGPFVMGVSKVVFARPGGSGRVEVGAPYVWRDDFIQVRVPVGQGAQRIPKNELTVSVEGQSGVSAALPFQVLFRLNAPLTFVQRSLIVAHEEVSGFLGQDTDKNKARSKDCDVGDVNGDGYPDLIDNNSNNVNNGTHSVLRVNQGGTGFLDFNWEAVTSGEPGSFVVTTPPGGKFPGNAIVYDADFVDLNNDELPDWVTGDAGGALRLRVAINNHLGVPGRFLESTDTWLPVQAPPGSPDDLRHTDINYDGFVDVLTSYRFSGSMDLFLNSNGTTFGNSVRLTASGSIHDVVFIDANGDGFADIVGANESGSSPLFFNDGNLPIPGFTRGQDFPDDAHSGVAADFNGDGLEDIAFSMFDTAAVYLNDFNNPGTFTRFALPDPQDFVYDLEVADVDLDGDLDLMGASVILGGNGDDASRIWINGGDGTSWTTWSDASDILPGIGPYQRLSTDMVDFDLDGDLDLYLCGSDGSGPWGFGASPNQFWENQLVGQQLQISGSCPGPATVRITAATPNRPLAILGSQTPGSTNLAGGPCAGTKVDLVSPRLLGIVTADANGVVQLNANLPQSACDFFIQAVDSQGCGVSNLVPVP